MKRSPWRDPEYRKDIFIVMGLFALGMIVTATLGLVAVWLLQLLGWWDLPLNIDLRRVTPF